MIDKICRYEAKIIFLFFLQLLFDLRVNITFAVYLLKLFFEFLSLLKQLRWIFLEGNCRTRIFTIIVHWLAAKTVILWCRVLFRKELLAAYFFCQVKLFWELRLFDLFFSCMLFVNIAIHALKSVGYHSYYDLEDIASSLIPSQALH